MKQTVKIQQNYLVQTGFDTSTLGQNDKSFLCDRSEMANLQLTELQIGFNLKKMLASQRTILRGFSGAIIVWNRNAAISS